MLQMQRKSHTHTLAYTHYTYYNMLIIHAHEFCTNNKYGNAQKCAIKMFNNAIDTSQIRTDIIIVIGTNGISLLPLVTYQLKNSS